MKYSRMNFSTNQTFPIGKNKIFLNFFITLFLLSHSFANSIRVGGYIPEKRCIKITPNNQADFSLENQSIEAAIIEIDNNLATFELVFNFQDQNGNADAISDIRLEPMDGVLGEGLIAPNKSLIRSNEKDGQFIWSPGIQLSATEHYRVKVMVTCKRPLTDLPRMAVNMPATL